MTAECDKDSTYLDIGVVLHRLRNPHECTDDEMLEARLRAADYIERIETNNRFEMHPNELGQSVVAACMAGKWSLIAPDGVSWIGRDAPVISAVILSHIGIRFTDAGEG